MSPGWCCSRSATASSICRSARRNRSELLLRKPLRGFALTGRVAPMNRPTKGCACVFLVAAVWLACGGKLARAQEPDPAAAARTIVEHEAKFYQLGQDQGTKPAFLQFLADDSIVFSPGPVNGKQEWQKRPEKGLSLKWTPVFAAMARSADVGYTTGPAEWRK